MKIFIRTKKIYTSFVSGATLGNHGHQVSIDVEGHPDYFPKEYDVGISFMSTYKVPKSELDKTWFNFHPAPLPEYKGRNLCYHAIMNGAKYFGASVHYMDEDFDTGDIIKDCKFDIEDFMTAEDVWNLAIFSSQILFKDIFPRIVAGEGFKRFPNVGGTYYKKQEIEDTISLNDVPLERWIRAVTYGDFHPKLDIGGVTYNIVREE